MTTFFGSEFWPFQPYLDVLYLNACNMQVQPEKLYNILVEIDNNVIEPNSAKQNIVSGQTIRKKIVIDLVSAANSGDPAADTY
jgi:hypothetical protein